MANSMNTLCIIIHCPGIKRNYIRIRAQHYANYCILWTYHIGYTTKFVVYTPNSDKYPTIEIDLTEYFRTRMISAV